MRLVRRMQKRLPRPPFGTKTSKRSPAADERKEIRGHHRPMQTILFMAEIANALLLRVRVAHIDGQLIAIGQIGEREMRRPESGDPTALLFVVRPFHVQFHPVHHRLMQGQPLRIPHSTANPAAVARPQITRRLIGVGTSPVETPAFRLAQRPTKLRRNQAATFGFELLQGLFVQTRLTRGAIYLPAPMPGTFRHLPNVVQPDGVHAGQGSWIVERCAACVVKSDGNGAHGMELRVGLSAP